MPNAEGRAAKKATPAKRTTPAAASPAAEEKPERHVRTPLERAQAVFDKAKAASDKIGARLATAQAEVKTLEAEAEEAKVTLDWAANHPLLVKARKEAGQTDEQRQAEASLAADAATPTRDDDYTDAGVDATPDEPAPVADVFEQGDDSDEAPEPAAAVPPFETAAAVVPEQTAPEFDFDSGRVTRV